MYNKSRGCIKAGFGLSKSAQASDPNTFQQFANISIDEDLDCVCAWGVTRFAQGYKVSALTFQTQKWYLICVERGSSNGMIVVIGSAST